MHDDSPPIASSPTSRAPAPLGYAAPPPRPSILTAVGVASVLAAVVYGLLAGAAAVTTLTLVISTNRPPAAGAPKVAMPTIVPAAPGGRVGGSALGFGDRAAALDGIARHVALTPARRAALDAMLQQPAVALVPRPDDAGPVSTDAVAATVSNVVVTTVARTATDRLGVEFDLPAGHVQLVDPVATFWTADGRGVFTSPYTDVVMVWQRDASGSMSPTHYTTSPRGAANAAGLIAAAKAGPPVGSLAPATLAAMAADALARLAMATWLFAAGVLVILRSPRGRVRHVRWAWAQLAVAALGGAVTWGWLTELIADAGPIAVARSDRLGPVARTLAATGSPAVTATMLTAAACLYPIAVLVVMRRASVRDHYAGRSTGGTG